ncbi:minor capsid protein [Microtetraspora niveoalba]|uniref:minor capsid protein n=1 Tax=Microtetraspora niveoalba TaxID=46175 RepID=UPI000831F362|nr:minor capsid protein [Microtetraspora niveoalba]
MTLLEEFAALLAALGLGTYKADGSTGGTIFLTVLPASPDRAMAVARYGGPESAATDDYDEPSIQVRVRGPATDARIAEQDAQAVYDKLHAIGSRVLAGGTWLQDAIGVQSGPIYVGRDQNGRHEYTVNLRCEISRPSVNRSHQ